MDKRQKKRLAILDVLSRSGQVLSSTRITELLVGQNIDISERSVRLYLRELDEEGLTDNHGRRGRIITEKGKHESVGRSHEHHTSWCQESFCDLYLSTGADSLSRNKQRPNGWPHEADHETC